MLCLAMEGVRTSGFKSRTFVQLMLLFSFIGVSVVNGSTYKDGEKVILYVNKVGPYFNNHETYHYYQLPVCRPDKIQHKSLTLGEVLDGDRMAFSNYDIKFKVPIVDAKLCTVRMDHKDLEKIRSAVEELYYFEFVLDDLPLRGFIGHLEEGGFLPHTHKLHLWTHLTFNIEYNENKIIGANVSTKDHSPLSLDNLEAPVDVTHTYSVNWIPSKLTYAEKIKEASLSTTSSLNIHWLSIMNSAVLVVLLIGFVTVILTRILKNDFARYNTEDKEMDADEYGWKIIYTDVFRFPPYKSLFCAVLGVGSQFLAIAFGIMVMALFDIFNVHHHGSMNTAACLLYAFTSCIAGYISAKMYKQMGEDKWVSNVHLTCCVFAVPFFVIWSVQNSIAWAYNSTQALPYTTIILLLAIWIFVGYPLTVLGAIFGKNLSGSFDASCRTKNFPREIPSTSWYRSAISHCAVGGFLPFSAVSVELYYIFATVWGREPYTLYGVLFIVSIILISVTGCISIALTYFQLSAEDYRWWWRSICSAGSTAVFVFIYAMFYYFRRSNMDGTLQAVQFFGNTLLICYVFFLALGTVSFFASLQFVRYIYRNIKMD
ncbi:transmembrane 9 superfamily member 1-like [Tachypleus tridentatus]|uniref:transmembrane 9 superfamily member 1-like n=1 Tax=Tachypleus tridentatus TaxID=6853 RepID=UPI003FCF23D8